MITRVLLATDFSPSSHKAAAMATEIASRFKAPLDVLHIYGMAALTLPDGTFYAAPDYAARVAQSAQEALDAEVARLKAIYPHVQGILKADEAYQGIMATAQEVDASLIVMGTRGRRGLPRMIMGSVAERVVRLSTIPVLTVHGETP